MTTAMYRCSTRPSALSARTPPNISCCRSASTSCAGIRRELCHLNRGLRRIAERLGALGLPTLVVQEGGYAVRNLRVGASSFFAGLAASWFAD